MRKTSALVALAAVIAVSAIALADIRNDMLLYYAVDMLTTTVPVSEATAVQAAKEYSSGDKCTIYCPYDESAAVLPCTSETIRHKETGETLGYAVRFGERECAFVHGVPKVILAAKHVQVETNGFMRGMDMTWEHYADTVRYGTILNAGSSVASASSTGTVSSISRKQ